MASNENNALKPRISAILRKYRFEIGFALTIAAIYFTNRSVGTEAFDSSVSNTIEMLSLLPPVFILVGLLDVWVPKETIIRYMGENSGWKGIIMAFFPGICSFRPSLCRLPDYSSTSEEESKAGIRIVFPWSMVHN